MTCMKVYWEGVTARIWTANDYIHIFLHISLCVCEKVHMCTDTVMCGGGGYVCVYVQVHIEARGQFQMWFLRYMGLG